MFWTWIGEGPFKNAVLDSAGSHFDIQNRVTRLSIQLRQAYVDYIGLIGTQQPAHWWRTAVSEKNPYVSNAFFNTCCIKACQDAVAGADEGSRFLLIVQDSALRRALHRNLKGAGIEVRLFDPALTRLRTALGRIIGLVAHQAHFILQNVRMVVSARYRYRLHRTQPIKAIQASGVPICITHIWIDLRAYSPETGQFKDVDFADVTAFLRSRGKTVAGLANIRSSASYGKVAAYIARSPSAFLVPHSFLSMRDIFACVLRSVARVPQSRDYPAFAELQIDDLIVADLRDEWYRARDAEHVLMERWVERLRESGIQVERFIYPFENHTWERVICNSLKTVYPPVRLIGYQPNGLPLLLLNYFISEAESRSIPLPDRIVANGPYTARILAATGLGSGRVVLGGGLRQIYLQGLLYANHRPLVRTGIASKVLVTPSIGRYRTVELIHKVVRAFQDSPEIAVIIKCHPSMRFEQLRRFLGPLKLPQNISISIEPILALLPDVDVLVYNDGTFPAAEALAFGIPVVFVEPEHGLYLDSLDGFPHIRHTARTAEEIAAIVPKLLKPGDKEQRRAAGLDVVRQLVGEVTEKTYQLFAD